MPRLARALVLFAIVALGCKKKSVDAQPAITRDIPSSSATSAADAIVPPDSNADATKPLVVPTVGCDTSPEVRFTVEPASAFSCSPMRTSIISPLIDMSCQDESGAKTSSLDLTVSPGTVLSIAVGVKNPKDVPIPVSSLRFETKGFPPSAKVDPATQSFQWKVVGASGGLIAGSIATIAKLPGGEKCARQQVVIRILDDDSTRANQVGSKVKMEQLWRQIGCMYAHQGPDMAANAKGDLQDELLVRNKIACGDHLVRVSMRDLDGDGLRDAMASFLGRPNPDLATDPSAKKFRTGPSVQLLLRKGDDFVRVAEVPGEPFEADDGTALFLFSNEDQDMACPPRPFASTGGPFCGTTGLLVQKWTGTTVAKVAELTGDELPGADALDWSSCKQERLEILKDGSGRVTGYKNGARMLDWKGTPKTK